MSISAIATGGQGCLAEIKWLHQCYVLDAKEDAFCILEFIAEVKKGILKYIDLHLPYKIEGLQNTTANFLDENNKYFYTEGFKVISVSKENAKNGEIMLDGIKTGVGEVALAHAPTTLGSKVTVNFLKEVSQGERRAIRIQFDCKNLSIKPATDKHSITLTYYDFNDAKFLNLSTAVPVNNLYVWVVFPFGADSINNITPPFTQQRIWDDINLKLMEAFYGTRTKAIWSKLPRTFGLWARHVENKEPALRAWSSLYLNCDYVVRKSGIKEIPKDETGKPQREIYEVYTSDSSGIGTVKKESSEKEIKQKYLKMKPESDIFVYHRSVYLKRQNKPIEMDRRIYNLLILFLKYKDKPLSTIPIYRRAWFDIEDKYLGDDEEIIVRSWLKPAISELRTLLYKVSALEIKKPRWQPYVCRGSFTFCVIIGKDEAKRRTLQEAED